MTGEILAIIASLLYAVSSISIKKGIQDTSLFAGLIISLGSGAAVILPMVMSDLWGHDARGALLYSAAGLLGSLVGRGASMAGIDRLGASASVSLEGTLYPFAAVLTAIVYFQADVGRQQIGGTIAIVLGIWLLSQVLEQSAFRGRQSLSSGNRERRSTFLPSLRFPLGAGLSFAAADLLRDRAVDSLARPLVGTFFGMLSGFLACLLLLLLPRTRGTLVFGPRAWWFVLQGAATAAATLCAITALQTVDVSVVSPILAAQPLPVLGLSVIFLRDLERVDVFTIAGALAIIVGAGLIVA